MFVAVEPTRRNKQAQVAPSKCGITKIPVSFRWNRNRIGEPEPFLLTLMLMTEILRHRGVVYSIPRTDDGAWYYKIHPGRLRADSPRPRTVPPDGYSARDAAIEAAEQAIDEWLKAG